MQSGGVPHRRRRVYIVGLKRCGRASVPFAWPADIAPVSLDAIFDNGGEPKLQTYRNYPLPVGPNGGNQASNNITKAILAINKHAAQAGRCPTSYPVIVDIGSSSLNMGIGHAPCVTEARGKTLGFWKLQQVQRLTITELFRLQGFCDKEVNDMKMVLTPSQMGDRLGAGFTKTVI